MLHNEARKLLAEAYEKYGHAKELAKAYGVSENTVYRIVRRFRKDGNANVRTSTRGRKPKLNESDEENIKKPIEAQNDITISEVKEKLHLDVDEETVRSRVIKLGFRYKKKSLHAAERDRLRCAGKTSRLGKKYVCRR